MTVLDSKTKERMSAAQIRRVRTLPAYNAIFRRPLSLLARPARYCGLTLTTCPPQAGAIVQNMQDSPTEYSDEQMAAVCCAVVRDTNVFDFFFKRLELLTNLFAL